MEAMLGRKGPLIHLGACHCIFSKMAHSMGWNVTALDVRTGRVPHLREEISFIHADVNSDKWNAADDDLMLCLGLYYHLGQDMQHKLLLRCRGKPFIFDTFFANPTGVSTRIEMLTETFNKNGEVGADYHEGLNDEHRKTKELLPLSIIRQAGGKPVILLSTPCAEHGYGWPHMWVFDYEDMNHFQRTFIICHTVDPDGESLSGIRFSPPPVVSRVAPRRRTARSEDEMRMRALEAEVAALRASTSWRITAPLRAVVRAVRGR